MSARYPAVQLWDNTAPTERQAPQGLRGAPCPERSTMAQGKPVINWDAPHRMCRYCGRVTPRVDDEGMAWCGGKVRT